jgi:acid phosphatase type 7
MMSRWSAGARWLGVCSLVVGACTCTSTSPTQTSHSTATAVSVNTSTNAPTQSGKALPASLQPRDGETIFVGAGDIAGCEGDGDEKTAAQVMRVLALQESAWAFTLGDNVYPDGTREEFARCYQPSWGQFRLRTLPVVGNHEYHTEHAAGFRANFAGRFTADGPLYYSHDAGPWRLLMIDSDAQHNDVTAAGAQAQWLQQQLQEARAANQCTALLMHHPRFSSGPHGDEPALQDVWQMFANLGGDVVLAGHDHLYERMQPESGVTSFVVGTGGRSHYPVALAHKLSAHRQGGVHGVIVLHLRAGGLRHQFLTTDDRIIDAGEISCRP